MTHVVPSPDDEVKYLLKILLGGAVDKYINIMPLYTTVTRPGNTYHPPSRPEHALPTPPKRPDIDGNDLHFLQTPPPPPPNNPLTQPPL